MWTTIWTTSCDTTRPALSASSTELRVGCADERREFCSNLATKQLEVQAHGIMETAAKKIKMFDKWIIKNIVDKVDNFFDLV